MKTKKGFTLIELLIVIAIIGVLAVAFLPSLLNAPAKGRDAQRLATVQKVQNFVVTQMLTNSLGTADTGCIDTASSSDANLGKLINTNIASFGGVAPKDPDTAIKFTAAGTTCTGQYLFVKHTGTSPKYKYAVVAGVENKENSNVSCSNVKADGTTVLTPGAVTLAGTDTYCYAALLQ